MEHLSISDIVGNLRSAFRERDFRAAELALIRREQQLRMEKLEMEAKYNGVLMEKAILKKQYDELGREKAEEVDRKLKLEKELKGLRETVARLEGENVRSGSDGLLEKVRGLEEEERKIRERVEMAERRQREGKKENATLLEKIKGIEKEKKEAERREREKKQENMRLSEKVKDLEEWKEKAERKEREVRGEIEKHLQKIECLKKDKERALAEAEIYKNSSIAFMEQVSMVIENPNAGDTQARSHRAPDDGAAVIIDISDNDDEGAHPPNGLKRKRDPSVSSNLIVADRNGDVNFTRRCKSNPPSDFSYGAVKHSPCAVTSGHGTSASGSITTPKCRDEKLAADVSWQFEADMLKAFDKDPILTMEAVCALYRQQKSHGSLSSRSAFLKHGGFNSLNALRGTVLAEFLLDGDPQSSMKKSQEELQRHDPKGLSDCKMIASSHLRQLFEIYQRKEDPFFGPR